MARDGPQDKENHANLSYNLADRTACLAHLVHTFLEVKSTRSKISAHQDRLSLALKQKKPTSDPEV